MSFLLDTRKAPLPQTSCKQDEVVVWFWLHVNWNVSPHRVVLRLNIDAMGLQVVFVFVCVWSSRFPLHPSLWQRRTNQSPPCLFSFHHTRPTSSFISRTAFMKTHRTDHLAVRWTNWGLHFSHETLSFYLLCVRCFLRGFTRGEETLVKVMILVGLIYFEIHILELDGFLFNMSSRQYNKHLPDLRLCSYLNENYKSALYYLL